MALRVDLGGQVDLIGVDDDQLSTRGRLARHGRLCRLQEERDLAVCLEVSDLIRLDVDQSHTRVILITSVFAVLLVVEPSFEAAVEVLLDFASVGVDGGCARDGNPVACLVVQVGNVDVGVGFAIITAGKSTSQLGSDSSS